MLTAEFLRIFQGDPRSAEALAARGSILYLMKDFDGARNSWSQSLELNPSQASVREALLDLSVQINGSRLPAGAGFGTSGSPESAATPGGNP